MKGWLAGDEEELSAAPRPDVLSHQRDNTWSLWPGHTRSTVGYQDQKSVQPQGEPLSAEMQEPHQYGVSEADAEEQCSGATCREHTSGGALESQPMRKSHQEHPWVSG